MSVRSFEFVLLYMVDQKVHASSSSSVGDQVIDFANDKRDVQDDSYDVQLMIGLFDEMEHDVRSFCW